MNDVNHCPDCGTDDISYMGHFEDGAYRVDCQVCPASWWEIWECISLEMIEGNDNRGAKK